MLSRSNSTANTRLRRAKSTSSTHTHTSSSSGGRHHQQTHPSIPDPFITRHQAEVAAAEAYERARANEVPACPAAYRAVPPPQKLSRRRQSQVTGRSEGRHLEDARLGRRKSGRESRKENGSSGNAKSVGVQQQQQRQQNLIIDESTADGISVVRRRYVVPPNNRTSQHQGPYDNASLPSSTRRTRRSENVYGDGSPIPRHNPSILKNDRSSTLQYLHIPRADGHSDSYSSDDIFARLSDFDRREDDGTMQTDAEKLAMARDKCLQAFHQHQPLRERKSFILAPFQKRRGTTSPNNNNNNYDTKLPPFNHADEFLPPPPPMAVPIPSNALPRGKKKNRNFSDSLRSRFKKVFRKVSSLSAASRISGEVPVQHVEAKHLHHFPVSYSPSLPTPEMGEEGEEDPFVTASSERKCAAAGPAAFNVQIDGCGDCGDESRRESADGKSIATRSRVTSWGDSTLTGGGTWSTRNDGEVVEGISSEAEQQDDRLKRSDSVSTLRKASSFFGRPLKGRLRRPSKAELRSSEESAGLYSALQERIVRPEQGYSAIQAGGNSDETPRSVTTTTTTSALATLPSQQQKANSSLTSTKINRWGSSAPTIRSVTPNPTAYKLDIPSPVTEVLSPDPNSNNNNDPAPIPHHNRHEDADEQTEDQKSDEQNSSSPTPTPRSKQSLQRRPAVMKKAAPMPSQEQIARRVEKSKNRWQSPLDELSPPPPPPPPSGVLAASGLTRAAMMMEKEGENPYELNFLSRGLHLQEPVVSKCTDLPHHAKILSNETEAPRRENVGLSPSLYSQDTDGVTPTPSSTSQHDTPTPTQIDYKGGGGDMMVTITGREVRRYSISPPKRRTQQQQQQREGGEKGRSLQGSSDWRRWLSSEMNGLNGSSVGLEEFVLPKDVLKDRTSDAGEVEHGEDHVQGEESRVDCEAGLGGAGHDIDVAGYPLEVNGKASGFMNEQQNDANYGAVSSGTATRHGRSDNEQRGPQTSCGEGISTTKERTKRRNIVNEQGPPRSRSVAHIASASNMQSSPDTGQPNFGAGKANSANNNQPPSTTTSVNNKQPSREPTTRAYKPRSAFDLRANYKHGNSEKAKPIAVVRRKPSNNNENFFILEDTTIQNISAGPYASYQQPQRQQQTVTPISTADANKENSPPSEANSLPVRSSSEWLAAGTKKKREVKPATGLQQTSASGSRSRSVSRHSPARTSVPSGGSSSPGQRLVTNWLDGKKEKGDSPGAFV